MWTLIGIGRGYIPADRQNPEGKPIGFIPIDSVYSPILKVNFSVTHQRVKERMNFDRLILDIHSNGAVEPKIAPKAKCSNSAILARSHWKK